MREIYHIIVTQLSARALVCNNGNNNIIVTWRATGARRCRAAALRCYCLPFPLPRPPVEHTLPLSRVQRTATTLQSTYYTRACASKLLGVVVGPRKRASYDFVSWSSVPRRFRVAIREPPCVRRGSTTPQSGIGCRRITSGREATARGQGARDGDINECHVRQRLPSVIRWLKRSPFCVLFFRTCLLCCKNVCRFLRLALGGGHRDRRQLQLLCSEYTKRPTDFIELQPPPAFLSPCRHHEVSAFFHRSRRPFFRPLGAGIFVDLVIFSRIAYGNSCCTGAALEIARLTAAFLSPVL